MGVGSCVVLVLGVPIIIIFFSVAQTIRVTQRRRRGGGGEGYVVELVILRLKAHSSTNINDEFVLRSHGYEKDIEVEEVSKVMHYA